MYPFLSVKTNALRRFPNSEFTLTCRSNENALCDACAASDACPQRNSKKRCADFIPVLRFAINANLYSGLYNTIRIGKAWSDRLQPGQRVGIWDDVERRLTFAVVETSHWSEDKAEILNLHAGRNHIGMTLDSPASQMPGVLMNCYGNGFYTKSWGLSAIYLQPV
jgi:hypothetical protein